MSRLRIRSSRPDDVQALLDIWRRAVAETHDFVSADDRAAIDQAVAETYVPSAELMVAVDGEDRPIAFLGGTGREIDALFVDPRVNGQGVGRMLVEAFAGSGGGDLYVEVNEQNEGARGFYERLGFRVVGRKPLDGQGRPYPLLRLVR